MKISKQFMKEALAYVFKDDIFEFNPKDNSHHADPYLLEKNLQKLEVLINNNPTTLYYLKIGLAFLYKNPKLVHPDLLSIHSIPFTTQEIKPILTKVFHHFWPDGDIASCAIDHLMPIEIIEIPEEDWKILNAPDTTEEGLFN